MDEVKHFIWLTYHPARHEDGIWLRCRCGWEYHLGWMATPADAWFEEQEHRRAMAEKAPPTDIHQP